MSPPPDDPYSTYNRYGPAYPAGSSYVEPDGPPPKKTLGIWALVTGWLPCGLGWIACIVLAIMVFSKSSPGRDHGKKLAIFGLIGPVFYVLVIVGLYFWSPLAADRDSSGHVTHAGEVTVDGLRVGDCGAHALSGVTSLIRVVPCSDPHAFEVLATFELPESSSYPGDDLVKRLSEGGCVKRLKGMPELRGHSDLHLNYLHPIENTWPRQRTVVCMATADQPMTGSLVGS